MIFVITAVVAGFLATLFITPQARWFLRDSGIVGIDQQKAHAPTLPTSGGVAVILGFVVAVSAFLGLATFGSMFFPLLAVSIRMDLVLAALSATLAIGLIGLIDDIHVDRNGKEEKGAIQLRVGIAQKYKYIAPLIAALPLMAVSAGESTMTFPFLGTIDLGIIFPLVLVPIAVTSVVNAANMLAGQNGLETSMGAVACFGLGIFAHLNGALEASLIAFGMAGCLLAFLVFNAYPAKILPGDSLTYAFGAAYVSAVIIGNIERFGIILFAPWIIEAFLKLRSGFNASSLGILRDDGTLKPRHDKIYSLTHVLMRRRVTEPELVAIAAGGEVLLVAAALAVWHIGLL